jgi:hypothetical protein
MGYSSSGGPKGLGVILDSNTPLADLTKLIELIARVGNYYGGVTEAERDDITGDALYTGLLVFNTDADALELWDGSGWETVWEPDTDWQTLAPAAGWTAFGSGLKWRRKNGQIKLLTSVTRVSWTGTQTFGTLPVEARPTQKVTFVSAYGDVAKECYVNTDGTIQVNASGGGGITGSTEFPSN